MADFPGYDLAALGPDLVVESAPRCAITIEGAFLMQATDSVTGALFQWTSTGAPDFAGVGYPGPNAPQQIAISGAEES